MAADISLFNSLHGSGLGPFANIEPILVNPSLFIGGVSLQKWSDFSLNRGRSTPPINKLGLINMGSRLPGFDCDSGEDRPQRQHRRTAQRGAAAEFLRPDARIDHGQIHLLSELKLDICSRVWVC